MQFRELRRVLQKIVIAGLPATLGCDVVGVLDSSPDECYREVTNEFEIDTPTDPPLQLRVESCRVDADACFDLCNMVMARSGLPTASSCLVTFGGSSDVDVTTVYGMSTCPTGEGRRPAGLVEPHCIEADNPIGAWLAQSAWLEAASVPAFIYLARELDLHGAPRGLARAALAAARDEIRHAQIMTKLARQFGGKPPVVDVALPQPRSLEVLAIENAAEGCVRETWGAVVAMWQANRARDPEVRAVFRAIAEDEARHAALAWAVDRWVSTRLDADAIARVAEARAAAVRSLFEGEFSEALVVLGLPRGAHAQGLLSRTRHAVWGGGLS